MADSPRDDSGRDQSGEPSPEPARAAHSLLQVDLRTALWIIVWMLAGFAAFSIAHNASNMLTIVVIGTVLALALDGLVQNIRRRWNLSRSISVAIVGAGLLTVALLIMLVLAPPAVRQARDFSKEIPSTVEQFYTLPVIGHTLEKKDAAGKVQKWIDDLPANVSDDAIANTAERLVGGVFNTIAVVFLTFALLLDGDRIVNRGRRLVPEPYQEDADQVARVVHRTIGRYFGGSLTVAALMGLYVLTIALIFNVPLAPLAAIWAMFTDLIPQVGGFLGGAFLFVLAVSQSVVVALIVLALFVVYMNIENHVLQPAIVGQAVNLSPPTTMLAAFIGGAVAGVPGALIATPLSGAVKQLYLEFRFGKEEAPPRHRGREALRKLLGRFRRKQVAEANDGAGTESAGGTPSG